MKSNIIINTLLIGTVTSIAFILIQPLFGMLTLTSRHAAAYINTGNYNETVAVTLSWFVHVGVSIFYTLISLSVYNFKHSIFVNFMQLLVLGWITTLIATPANYWVIKLITTGKLTAISSLPSLNTDIGPKFWLHILFFTMVISCASFIRRITLTNKVKA